MRSDLDHLPPAKQRELERVVQIIFEEFGAAHENATSRRKRGRILKVILYGSHARGGWVDEPHTAKGYVSDFDLLIIVNQKELTDRAAYWTAAEQRLIEEKLAGRLRTPVNFVVHSWQEVGDGLAHGRFFFLDIARDGVVLQEVDDRPLPEPKPKTPQQALAMAQESTLKSGCPQHMVGSSWPTSPSDKACSSTPLSSFIRLRSAYTTVFCSSARSTRRTTTTWHSCARRPSGWICV